MPQFSEVLQRIKKGANELRRQPLQSADLLICGQREMQTKAGRRFVLHELAQEQLRKRLQLPKALTARLSTSAFTTVANELWEREQQARRLPEQLVIWFAGNRLVGFDDPGLLTLPSSDVIDAVDNALSECKLRNVVVRQALCEPWGFHVRLSFPSVTAQPRAGDVVEGGVAISHSAIGEHATQVHSYIHRLICENGLYVPVCEDRHVMRIRRLASRAFDHDQQLSRLREVLERAIAQLGAKLDALRALTNRLVEVPAALQQLALRQGLPRGIQAALVAAIDADEDGPSQGTEYDALMALTRVATHGHMRPVLRRRLLVLAGILSQQHAHVCPHCHSVLYPRRAHHAKPEPSGHGGSDNPV